MREIVYKISSENSDDFLYNVKFYCPFVKDFLVNEVKSEITVLIEEDSYTTKNIDIVNKVYDYVANKKTIEKKILYVNETQPKYRDDFRKTLRESGSVIENSKGIIGYKGIFLKLCNAFDNIFLDYAKHLNAEEISFPTLIELDKLDKCGYIASFAQYLTYATHLVEDFSKVKKYIIERGSENFHNINYVLTPAICLHCYIALQNSSLNVDRPLVKTAKGKCYRYESGNLDSYTRLWDFTMREIIFIGKNQEVEDLRQKSIQFIIDLVESLCLNCFIETANDPFFLGEKDKEYFQLLSKVKYELRIKIPFDNTTISVASFNIHGNHFGKAYNINNQNGGYVDTGCTAFGLERLAYAFLSQYGPKIENWPNTIKKRLLNE